jgi:integrase
MGKDFTHGKAVIRASRSQRGGQEKEPKTGIRTIDLLPDVIEALKRQQERTYLIRKWVWMNGNRQWTSATFHDHWKRVFELAKVRYRPPSQMRHTFASLHLQSGENPEWVSCRMMGHSDSSMMFQNYSRYIPNATRQDGSAYKAEMDKLKNGYNVVTMVAN